MNISLEKLQVCQGLWQNESNQFEKDLLNNDHNAKDSFLKKRTKPFFARELNNINESMDKNINNPKTLTTLKNKKRLYIEIASFIQDSEHQSRQSHTELMKECIDIRKAQEDTSSSELKKDIEEENFIFRDFVAGI